MCNLQGKEKETLTKGPVSFLGGNSSTALISCKQFHQKVLMQTRDTEYIETLLMLLISLHTWTRRVRPIKAIKYSILDFP